MALETKQLTYLQLKTHLPKLDAMVEYHYKDNSFTASFRVTLNNNASIVTFRANEDGSVNPEDVASALRKLADHIGEKHV